MNLSSKDKKVSLVDIKDDINRNQNTIVVLRLHQGLKIMPSTCQHLILTWYR